jgi:hypothetical protein
VITAVEPRMAVRSSSSIDGGSSISISTRNSAIARS